MEALNFLNTENEDQVGVRAKDSLIQESALGTRKAFRSINRDTENIKDLLKFHRTTSSPQKVSEETVTAKVSVPVCDDNYPEIEKFFPYNPLDGESYDLPEEHQIAHLPLSGIPLMFLEEDFEKLSMPPFMFGEQKNFGKLLYEDSPTPPKRFLPLWASNVLESPSLLSDSIVELPSPVYYESDTSVC